MSIFSSCNPSMLFSFANAFSLSVHSGTVSCHYSFWSTLWSFKAPSTISNESQDYWSQSPYSLAADVMNPCLNIISGAAGLLGRNIVHKITQNISDYIKMNTLLQKAIMGGSFSVAQRQMTTPLLHHKSQHDLSIRSQFKVFCQE